MQNNDWRLLLLLVSGHLIVISLHRSLLYEYSHWTRPSTESLHLLIPIERSLVDICYIHPVPVSSLIIPPSVRRTRSHIATPWLSIILVIIIDSDAQCNDSWHRHQVLASIIGVIVCLGSDGPTDANLIPLGRTATTAIRQYQWWKYGSPYGHSINAQWWFVPGTTVELCRQRTYLLHLPEPIPVRVVFQ